MTAYLWPAVALIAVVLAYLAALRFMARTNDTDRDIADLKRSIEQGRAVAQEAAKESSRALQKLGALEDSVAETADLARRIDERTGQVTAPAPRQQVPAGNPARRAL